MSAPADLAGFPDVWLGFLDAHPEVALQVEFTNRYVDVVREGFDLALRGGRGDDEALVARRLGAYALRAVAAPAWVARHGRLAEPRELRGHACVLLQPFRGQRSPRARHVVLDQLALVREACLRGHGVAIVPPASIDADIAAGRLVPVLDAYDPLRVPLYAAYPDRRFLPATTVAFLDHVAAAFGA